MTSVLAQVVNTPLSVSGYVEPEPAWYICQRYSLIRNEKGSLEQRGAKLRTTSESLTQGKYLCPLQKLCYDVYDIQKYV